MTTSITQQLRANLLESNDRKDIRLDLTIPWYNKEFISGCIDDIQKLNLMAQLGESPNNLERLAFLVLCDSAGIKIEEA